MSLSSIDWDSLTPEQLKQPYRPWRPKVGDRVRVRLSPECDWNTRTTDMFTGRKMATGGPHDDEEDGRVGTVDQLRYEAPLSEREAEETHPYAVTFDDPYWSVRDRLLIQGAHFAASELEPLEEP